MPKIEINTADGTTARVELLNYMQAQTKRPSTASIIPVLTGQLTEQRGETCKLKALYEAISLSALETGATAPKLYAQRTHETQPTIRRMAKGVGSVVGEIYSMHQLTELAKRLGYPSITYRATSPDDYLVKLTEWIDTGNAVVVFYEMDRRHDHDRYSYPAISHGEENEHAIVVVGYYRTEFDEVRLIVKNWDEYYDMDGMEMALSSMSLPETRTPEVFGKVYFNPAEEDNSVAPEQSEWLQKKAIDRDYPEIASKVKTRQALPISRSHIPLGNHLFSIAKPVPVLAEVDTPTTPTATI